MENIYSNLLGLRLFYISQEKYEKHSLLSSHFHPFPVIMFVIELKGECTYRIDGKTYNTQKGDLILCNPGTYHEKYLSAGSSITEFHLAFDSFTLIGLSPDMLIEGSSHAVIRLALQHYKYFETFKDLLEEQLIQKPGYETILKAMAIRLIIQALRDLNNSRSYLPVPSQIYVRVNKNELINHLKDFLYQNYNKDLYIEKIAKNMYVTPTYLCKIFKEVTGETPMGFLIKLRLNKAKELLEMGSYSIKEISKNIGYNDYYHFSKLFKKYYGVSPSKYKAT
jgi:AraC-like DNA-binding protein